MPADKILVANIGSTSFKFRVYAMPDERLLARGGVERIGASEPSAYKLIVGEEETSGTASFQDYDAAVDLVMQKLVGTVIHDISEIAAIGFKPVVADGVSGTQFLDEPVLDAMMRFKLLAPAHNPPYVNAVRVFNRLYPNTPCIGTFETAFFDHLGPDKFRLPVPLAWEKQHNLRHQGFHGASHRFVSERVCELRGTTNLRVITAHLGGSSSMACTRDGKAANFGSWGMTPQSGLPHNNRTGDLDVCSILHLIIDKGMSAEDVHTALCQDSGLKGMSGLNNGDIRDVREAAESGNADAAVALDRFIAGIRKYLGMFLVEMNGADVLAFTAGIGENNPWLRERICQGLDFCGLKLDAAANANYVSGSEAIISTPDSLIEIRVIPTNEEIIIARNAWAKLQEAAVPA